jgi:hypothetical protein
MIMHEHTPRKHKSRFIAFFHLLISPHKVFTYYINGADICGVCGTHITVPHLYYSPITNVLYAMFGLVLFLGVTPIPYLHFLVIVLGILLFHHVYSAAVFAFAPWDAYDPGERSAGSCAAQAKRELEKKAFWLIIGLLIPARFFLRLYL